MKLLGSIMIVCAGTGIGFALASRYNERPRQISQLIGCLAALKGCVNYIAMPLPEALVHCGGGADGPVRELFRRTGNILAASGWLSVRQAIETALSEQAGALAFKKPETELLLRLGANLGLTNREEQQKYLTMVVEELGHIEQESRRARDQNAKMFRYLGICGGLTIVLLLV